MFALFGLDHRSVPSTAAVGLLTTDRPIECRFRPHRYQSHRFQGQDRLSNSPSDTQLLEGARPELFQRVIAGHRTFPYRESGHSPFDASWSGFYPLRTTIVRTSGSARSRGQCGPLTHRTRLAPTPLFQVELPAVPRPAARCCITSLVICRSRGHKSRGFSFTVPKIPRLLRSRWRAAAAAAWGIRRRRMRPGPGGGPEVPVVQGGTSRAR